MTENPWLERRVLCYAHQGGAREAPSSTLWALREAVAHGADALELDVHATADGHLVVCHDATVDRTTNGTGAIATMTLDALRGLDNAYWWVPGSVVDHDATSYPLRGRAPDDHALGIATLDEVLDAFPHTFLNLDIKQTAPVVEPYEEPLARTLRAHGRVDDVIVASFNDAATDAFRAFAPEIGTSAGTLATAMFWQAAHNDSDPPEMPHVALQVPMTAAGVTVLDAVFVERAHAHGLAVHAWTIDEVADMETLVALGVDGIMSDVPSTVVGMLASAGATYSPRAAAT
jgi:glycerophosphoryl diester phosphodiesterase